MINKIKNYYQNAEFEQFQDIRVFGLAIFLIILSLIVWSGVKTIQTNYSLQKQISQLQQEVAVQSLMNNNDALKNTYFQTNQYLELAARQNFGLGAPGEKELLVSQNVALSHLSSSSATANSIKITSNQPKLQQNFQSWMNFFLNRQNLIN